MSHDEITRLYAYMTDRFDKLERALEAKADKADLNRVVNVLDSILKQQEIDREEHLVMGHQLTRLEGWVEVIANKVGYKLTT